MSSNSPLLILGARGTLGGQLLRLCPDAIAWDREDVDVLDADGFRGRLEALPTPPRAIVNCVAFNDVDGAEDRPEAAFALNAEFPARLAAWTSGRSIPLVHYSTNYVFDGAAGEYREADPPSPLSVYGRTKRAGEEGVIAASGPSYVVRTAVIFGPKGASDLSKKSFVDLMLDLSATRESLEVVDDEVNSVTFAPDLAVATLQLLASAPSPGVYHLANRGAASWYEFALEIFRLADKPTKVLGVPAARFPRKAKRPARAVLLNTLLPELRHWKAALAEFIGAGV